MLHPVLTLLLSLAPEPALGSVRVELDVSALPHTTQEGVDEKISEALASGGVEVSDTAQTVMQVQFTRVDADMKVEIKARRDGVVVTDATEICEICGRSELHALVGDMVGRIAEKLTHERTRGRLHIEGRPSGADVFVDGELRGAAPLDLELGAGDHVIEVRAEGRESQGYEWSAVGGVHDTFKYSLARVITNDDADGLDQGGGLMRALGWTALGTGVAATAAGATLWILDGRAHQPSCDPSLIDINGVCPQVFVTKAGGIALVAGGAASLVASVPLLVIGHKNKRSAQVSFGVRPGGAWLSGWF